MQRFPTKRILFQRFHLALLAFIRISDFLPLRASLLFSGLTQLLEKIVPLSQPMTSQPLMELIFAVSLPAVGSAILFNLDASSGGTDIVAMVLKKYTSLNIGRALLYSDCVITVMACVAFGMETGLFSILGLLMKSLLVDMVLENINTHKCFHIITTHPEVITDFIVNNLHRGATQLHGEGASGPRGAADGGEPPRGDSAAQIHQACGSRLLPADYEHGRDHRKGLPRHKLSDGEMNACTRYWAVFTVHCCR